MNLDKKASLIFVRVVFSDEWFVADGTTSIAIPFYLAHKRLAALQKYFLYEIEGGTPGWFMQLLRHECGHAIDNAYGLRRKKKRQTLFGKSSTPYDDYYIPKPYSKKHVIHLDTWYAQSHPDEDFAETFAVWLNPKKCLEKRYKDWKVAYQKLQYVDQIMQKIGSTKPKNTSRVFVSTTIENKKNTSPAL
ncbi:MAG: putative zinc-binding metallopeptidase [Bdellovibrionota bacterium]